MFVTSLVVALSLSQAPAAGQTGRIAGRVTLAGANTPIAGARVMLVPTARPVTGAGGVVSGLIGMPPQTTTDDDGRYAFENLAPGGYRINVQKQGLAPLTLEGPGTPPGPLVQVAAGQSVDGVDRQLQKGAIITGRVVDSKGEPLAEVSMMVMRRVTLGRSGAPPRLLPVGQGHQTNDLGEFRIAGLASGEYYVAAVPRPAMFVRTVTPAPTSAPRMTLARTFYPGTTDEAAAQLLSVTAGNELNNISFAMQSVQAFRISGTVVDEDGSPIADAMVILSGDGASGNFGPGGSVHTEPGGRFTIVDVPPGSYRLHASPIVTSNGSAGFGAVVSGSSGNMAGQAPPPIVVTDADVTGLKVATPRPTRQ
jgi:protocatechuate 3,4-dioxygenase beta subunit